MFVSQKCTVEYLRLRAGLNWEALCRNAVFRDGLEHCRWGAFVRVLGDVAEVCETVLRTAKLSPTEIERLVPPAVAVALARYPATSHPPGRSEALEQIVLRLARRRVEPPRPIRRIGAGSAKRILALLPFDDALRAADLDYLDNNLCFALGQVHERLCDALDPAALAQCGE